MNQSGVSSAYFSHPLKRFQAFPRGTWHCSPKSWDDAGPSHGKAVIILTFLGISLGGYYMSKFWKIIYWMLCTYMCIVTYIHTYIALHCITLHCIALHYIRLHYIHYITLHHIHYITSHHITLHYITLHTSHHITSTFTFTLTFTFTFTLTFTFTFTCAFTLHMHYFTLLYITWHYVTLHYINYITYIPTDIII